MQSIPARPADEKQKRNHESCEAPHTPVEMQHVCESRVMASTDVNDLAEVIEAMHGGLSGEK